MTISTYTEFKEQVLDLSDGDYAAFITSALASAVEELAGVFARVDLILGARPLGDTQVLMDGVATALTDLVLDMTKTMTAVNAKGAEA